MWRFLYISKKTTHFGNFCSVLSRNDGALKCRLQAEWGALGECALGHAHKCSWLGFAVGCCWALELAVFCHNWHFGDFLPSLGNWHACPVAFWHLGVGGPENWGHLPCPHPKWAPKAQRGKAWHGCQNTIFL